MSSLIFLMFFLLIHSIPFLFYSTFLEISWTFYYHSCIELFAFWLFILFPAVLLYSQSTLLFMACCSCSVGALTSLTPKAITSFSGCSYMFHTVSDSCKFLFVLLPHFGFWHSLSNVWWHVLFIRRWGRCWGAEGKRFSAEEEAVSFRLQCIVIRQGPSKSSGDRFSVKITVRVFAFSSWPTPSERLLHSSHFLPGEYRYGFHFWVPNRGLAVQYPVFTAF